LDRWVLDRLLRHHADELHAVPDVHLSVNLSARSRKNARVGHPRDGSDPGDYGNSSHQQSVPASRFIERVRAAGCTVALDDFGVGLCSFSYLREFKVDFIKIEGRFVRNIVNNKVDRSIVRAINNIAHEIEAQTIAEFVEDDSIFQAIKELQVDFAQGYAIGRPEPVETIWAGKATAGQGSSPTLRNAVKAVSQGAAG
jgi:EAL domain-containing protein (putative c-di-GMP-specific phosphodiesterase class I)